MTQRKIDWTLTQGTFDRLLDALDADRTTAGERYEHIRAALVRFFECRAGRAPDECADEVIDRVSRKLHDGEAIADVRSYCYGVARLLLLEKAKEHAREASETDMLAAPVAPDDTSKEMQLECLDRCMNSLPRIDRDLILEYHRDRGLTKIRARKSMAEALGIASGTLRIRAHRIRLKLEQCVSECVERGIAMKHSSAVPHINERG